MPAHSFEELYDQAMVLYGTRAFGEVLDLMTAEGGRFPDHAAEVYYLRSCMAARLDRPEQAIGILQEALDRGLWYGEQMMHATPSWQPLQGLPAFRRLAAICKERQDAEHIESRVFVLEPAGGCATAPGCPLLLALHGNGDNGTRSLQGWAPVAAAGWLLAALQSSQVASVNAYIWDDQATALGEVATQYAALQAQHTLDPTRVLIAGFSMGGETALRAALEGTIPARGFILLGPGGPGIDTPDSWLPLIARAAGRGLRGYVLIGEADNNIPQAEIRMLVDLLNSHGIPCLLETLPGMKHEYPADFGPVLGRALAFVQQPGV